MIDLFQFMVFFRTHRTEILNKATYYFSRKLTDVAKVKGFKYEEILHCTKDEVLENRIPNKKEIADRIEKNALIAISGKTKVYTGSECDEIKSFFDESFEGISSINGISASRGITKGMVLIIKDNGDFHKFEDNGILVTSMTTPDFMPLMKKAVAIITDEGGITCHAAIVARELKKPCIIGTKIATQVLKDGDLVEVDADKGVVKIIKKVGEK